MTIAMLVQGGLQIATSLQQGDLIRSQAELSQRIREKNAEYLERDAWEAERFGYTQTARYQTVVDQTISQQKLAFAEQNVDSTSGTAGELLKESKLNGFLNTIEIKQAARTKALNLKRQASNMRLTGEMDSIQAGIDAYGTQLGGTLQGIGTVIGAYNTQKEIDARRGSTGYGV